MPYSDAEQSYNTVEGWSEKELKQLLKLAKHREELRKQTEKIEPESISLRQMQAVLNEGKKLPAVGRNK